MATSASSLIGNPLYPDVPVAAGVPNVLRLPGAVASATTPLTGDDPSLAATAPQWGIFDANGASVLDADTIASVEVHSESTISDFPVEQGSFQSYNKVDRPATFRVRVAKSGASAARTAFLSQIEDLRHGTDVCTVVTPERAYDNVNVVDYSYARSATEGAQMIVAELQLEEIRQQATTAYSNTANPSGADAVNAGSVQPQVTTAVTSIGPPAP